MNAALVFDVPGTTDLRVEALQATQKWKLDPARVRRALVLLSYERVHQINFTFPREFIVRSLNSPNEYLVNPDEHTCTCRDHTKGGHICKHRIAVYLYCQRLERAAREDQLIKELGF